MSLGVQTFSKVTQARECPATPGCFCLLSIASRSYARARHPVKFLSQDIALIWFLLASACALYLIKRGMCCRARWSRQVALFAKKDYVLRSKSISNRGGLQITAAWKVNSIQEWGKSLTLKFTKLIQLVSRTILLQFRLGRGLSFCLLQFRLATRGVCCCYGDSLPRCLLLLEWGQSKL